jgi:putative radical SAM enzyme (TIGR03279 family)
MGNVAFCIGVEFMGNEIAEVMAGSLAEELELEPGDKLLTINGQEVKDILDYRFLMCDENVVLEIEKSSGEIWELDVEKDFDENLGVVFKESIMDKASRCSNNCIFCFIDQLPKGMRETLYFKDDDSRLSFLQGNFVTLTNMSDEDLDRIIKYRISPINISVHTTNPELRVTMLRNRFAGNIYSRLKKLAEAGIEMNCQVVLCPGINDGDEFRRTCMDLFALYPQVQNIAAVPIGLTRFREGLYGLKLYDKASAEKQITEAGELQKYFMDNAGVRFVRLSDEFYVTAGIDVPEAEFYDGFHQLEDGVGIIRSFRDNAEAALDRLTRNKRGSFTLVTGESAYREISAFAEAVKKLNGRINIDAAKITNNFFGESITVAGLITGTDIISQLSKRETNKYLVIPDTMLRKGYEPAGDGSRVLLDDITIEDIEQTLNKKIIVTDYTGEDIVDQINLYCEEVI